MLSRDRGSSDMLRAIIGLVLCVALGAPAAMSQSLPAPSIAAIDQAMNRAVDTGWVPGGVVAVARGGKVVFEKGYGRANLETGTPANPDNVPMMVPIGNSVSPTCVADIPRLSIRSKGSKKRIPVRAP